MRAWRWTGWAERSPGDVVRALIYSFQEAVSSLWRRRRASAVSVATIAAALVVLGGLLLVTWNAERLVDRWAGAAELSVYLRDDITPQAQAAVEETLTQHPAVAGFELVSKTEARNRFARDFADLADLDRAGAENPFPASFEVRLVERPGETTEVEQLALVLSGAGGVDEVRFDQEWVDRLRSAVGIASGIGFVFVAVLVAAAALTVANVVRLACFARRDEIEIMHLVGAPLTFVRGPFVAEGVLQGGIGAIAALGILGAGFAALVSAYDDGAAQLFGIDAVRFLPVGRMLLLILGGMLVGCVGGLVAARGTRQPGGAG